MTYGASRSAPWMPWRRPERPSRDRCLHAVSSTTGSARTGAAVQASHRIALRARERLPGRGFDAASLNVLCCAGPCPCPCKARDRLISARGVGWHAGCLCTSCCHMCPRQHCDCPWRQGALRAGWASAQLARGQVPDGLWQCLHASSRLRSSESHTEQAWVRSTATRSVLAATHPGPARLPQADPALPLP